MNYAVEFGLVTITREDRDGVWLTLPMRCEA